MKGIGGIRLSGRRDGAAVAVSHAVLGSRGPPDSGGHTGPPLRSFNAASVFMGTAYGSGSSFQTTADVGHVFETEQHPSAESPCAPRDTGAVISITGNGGRIAASSLASSERRPPPLYHKHRHLGTLLWNRGNRVTALIGSERHFSPFGRSLGAAASIGSAKRRLPLEASSSRLKTDTERRNKRHGGLVKTPCA